MSLALRRIWGAPAVQALLLQCAAVVPTLLVIFLLARAGVPVPAFGVALVQGAIAAALTWWRALAPWWRAIQLLFPAALVGALALELPPSLSLAAFVLLLATYWSTFRTQVPYYPSGRRVWHAVAQLLPEDRPVRLVDIGSGMGGLAMDLARRRPDSCFVGIELAPLPWLLSKMRARLSGSRARFVRGDYEQLDFSGYDVVFAYLSPAAMSALWQKAAAEMRPGSMLISYEFEILEKMPDRTILPSGPGPAMNVWHF